MKVAIGLFLLVVVLGLAAFKLGWLTPEDPKAMVAEIHNSVKPGMTWQEVVDIRRPRKYVKVNLQSFTGKTSPIDFDRDQFEDAMKKNSCPDGFMFRYTFSVGEIVEVSFDGNGKVQWVEDPITYSDLLQGNRR